MFTAEHHDHVRARVLDLARADPWVTVGALSGSMPVGAEDEWPDIDVAFGIADGASPDAVLHDWTDGLGRDFGVLDRGRHLPVRRAGTGALQDWSR